MNVTKIRRDRRVTITMTEIRIAALALLPRRGIRTFPNLPAKLSRRSSISSATASSRSPPGLRRDGAAKGEQANGYAGDKATATRCTVSGTGSAARSAADWFFAERAAADRTECSRSGGRTCSAARATVSRADGSKSLERRKHMTETIRLLKLQRDAAQQALARANRRVDEIINCILIARADREAGRVARLWQQLWNHYDRLAAMSGLWLQGGPLRLSPGAVTVLQKIGGHDDRFESTHVLSQVESEKSRSKSRHSARLKQWQQALLSDSDAELEE
jgi:hypothetical protein